MRSNTWTAVALSIAACGGSPSPAEPVLWTVTGAARPAPAGSPAAVSTCAALLPQPTVPIAVAACSGVASGESGATGTTAIAATGDASGALGLGCQNVQTKRNIFFAFVPSSGSYRKVAPLSERVFPLPSGFFSTGQVQPAPGYVFDRAGRMLASLGSGTALPSRAGSIEVVSASSEGLFAQQYGPEGVPNAAAVRLADVGADALVLGGAANDTAHTLVVWATKSDPRVQGRWLGTDGQPESAAFALAGTSAQIGAFAALPDGSVAVGGANGPRWRSVIAQSATKETPVPEWLAARGGFEVVRGGKALLFGSELVSADGTSCGPIGTSSAPVGVALDGTVVSIADEKTFHVYPQLLR
jgi:hypothetical protein